MPALPTGLYGFPPPEVIEAEADAVQLSPLVPGAEDLAAMSAGSLGEIALIAPPNTLERRFVLAEALRVLAPGGLLSAAALKDRGGLRLKKELEAFGCVVQESSRRHFRVCTAHRPDAPVGIDAAIEAGAMQQTEDGMWSQPGVFSWDRLDPATALLIQTMGPVAGRGADFGAGIGWLANAVLGQEKVARLTLVDIDRRAVAAARRNVDDPRAEFLWADARAAQAGLSDLDFIVTNPPFHAAGEEDRSLGQAFIRAASTAMKRGGTLWLVANRHLPYEAVLKEHFKAVMPRADAGGFKVYEARR